MSTEHVYKACRLSDRLFAVNPFLTQQNFYSQQVRALALAQEVAQRHLRPSRRRVCIVGAGITGRTLAAAFYTLGANVSLYDKEKIDFRSYLGANHRELHPNIIFWPFRDPVPMTSLPFLNWAQASAATVVEDLKDEWKAGFARKIECDVGEVEHVDDGADRAVIKFKDGTSIPTDICVLATGFSRETSVGSLETPRYWSPQSVPDGEDNVLVSGSGDGGLIDALSPILGSSVTKAAHLLASRLRGKALRQDVYQEESQRLIELIKGTRDSSNPCAFYSSVALEPEDAAAVNELVQHPECRVTLLHESTSAYSYTAAPINKLLLAHFSNGRTPSVAHVKGKLSVDSGGAVTLERESGVREVIQPPASHGRVFVRHGAVPALASILTDTQMEQLKTSASDNPEAATLSEYDPAVYAWSLQGVGSAKIGLDWLLDSIERALRHIEHAYGLRMGGVKFPDNWFLGQDPVKVYLSPSDMLKSEELGIFPLSIGPAQVITASAAAIGRGHPDE
jgi:thioredoxin reductase